MNNRVKNIINSLIRLRNGLRRPSAQRNRKLLQERGESITDFSIRKATSTDIPALAALHVRTWNDTYGSIGPSVEMREYQWRELFMQNSNDWFVLLVLDKNQKLIGFAKAQLYHDLALPEFGAELNKIYLLKDYQRLGLGKKLVVEVSRRLLDRDINSMVLFGIPQNPSCGFHEAMGGQRLGKSGDVFQGGYGWKDLRKILDK